MGKMLKVITVKEGSQAEQLGIKVGDLILSYNSVPVSSNIEFSNASYAAKEKGVTSVVIRVLREGNELKFEATLEVLGFACEEIDGKTPTSQNGSIDVVASNEDYKTSILMAKFVSLIGWVTCFVAVVIVISAFASVGRMGALALAPGLGILIGGLILVIAGQTSRAVMDNTNYVRQMLVEMRKNA